MNTWPTYLREFASLLGHALPYIANIVTSITAVIVAIVAIKGLNAWKRELKGKARYEAASKLMIACLSFQPAFAAARSPAIWWWQGGSRPRDPDEQPDRSPILDRLVIHRHRLEPLVSILERIQESRWAAEVILGTDAKEQVRTQTAVLMREFNLLSVSVNEYFRLQLDYLHQETPEAILTLLDVHRQRVYDRSDENGPDGPQTSVNVAVDRLSKSLEAFLG